MVSSPHAETCRRSHTGPSSRPSGTTSPISSTSSRTAASRRLSPSSTPPPGVYQNRTCRGVAAGPVSRAPSSSTRPSGSRTTTRAAGRTHGRSPIVENGPGGAGQPVLRQGGQEVGTTGAGAPQRLLPAPPGDRRVVAREQDRTHLVPPPGRGPCVGRALEQPVGMRVELHGLPVAHHAGKQPGDRL